VPNEKRTHFALCFSIIGAILTNDGVSLGKEREGDARGRANKTRRTRVFWQWRYVLSASCYKRHGLRGRTHQHIY